MPPPDGPGPIPCYRTARLDEYSDELRQIFDELVGLCGQRNIPEPGTPLQGSYSAVCPAADDERAAKLVIVEWGRGGWAAAARPRPDWPDGVYAWFRQTGRSGELLAQAMADRTFADRHRAVLGRLEKDGADLRLVSAAPNPADAFAYFRFEPGRDDPAGVVALIEACSRLGEPAAPPAEEPPAEPASEPVAATPGDADRPDGDERPAGHRVDWRERIGFDPAVCGGMPRIKGTRVPVSAILGDLAEGESHESIVEGHRVAGEDIRACLAFAAELATDRHVDLDRDQAG